MSKVTERDWDNQVSAAAEGLTKITRAVVAIDRESRGVSTYLDGTGNWDIGAICQLGCAASFLNLYFKNGIPVLFNFTKGPVLDVVMPTPLTDEEWRNVPGTASLAFWDKFPELLSSLQKRGHEVLPLSSPVYMEKAQKIVSWFKSLFVDGKAPIIVTDTDTADVASLNAIFTFTGHPPLTYDHDWNFGNYIIYNYSRELKNELSLWSGLDAIVRKGAAKIMRAVKGVKHDGLYDAKEHLAHFTVLIKQRYAYFQEYPNAIGVSRAFKFQAKAFVPGNN